MLTQIFVRESNRIAEAEIHDRTLGGRRHGHGRFRHLLVGIVHNRRVRQPPLLARGIILHCHFRRSELHDGAGGEIMGSVMEVPYPGAKVQPAADGKDALRVGDQLMGGQADLIQIKAGGVAQQVEKAWVHTASLLSYGALCLASGSNSSTRFDGCDGRRVRVSLSQS